MKTRKERISADVDIVNGKLTWGERIAWAGGEFTQNFMIQMMATFMMIYLLDVALLPAATIGIVMIVTKIVDGANDVLSGYLLDNKRLKLPFKFLRNSKFRPWIILMTPLAAIISVILFSIPQGAGEIFKLTWYVIASLMFGFVWDFVNGAHGALMSRMTQNKKERNLLSMLAGLGVMIAVMAVNWAVPFLMGVLGDARGFMTAAIIFNIIMIVGMYITAFYTKERLKGSKEIEQEKEGAVNKKKYTLIGMFRLWAKNKALIILFFVSIFSWLSQGFLAGMNPVYMKYYFGDLNQLWVLTTIGSILVFPSLIFAPIIANRVGKKNVYLFGLIISGLASILRGFVPAGNMPILIAVALPAGIGVGLFLGMAATIGVDAIEYGEWKNGIRSEGLNASINNFYKKIVTALAASVPAFILASTGYVANATVQTDAALRGIIWSSCFLPGICFIISAIIFGLLFPINKKTLPVMMDELKQRRLESND